MAFTDYTVRVELHDVEHESEPYKKLHYKMAQLGFVRWWLKPGTPDYYFLPPAEYVGRPKQSATADILAGKIREEAKKVLRTTTAGTKASVIVTEQRSFGQSGLNKATIVFHAAGLNQTNPRAPSTDDAISTACRNFLIKRSQLPTSKEEAIKRALDSDGAVCVGCWGRP